MRPALLALAAVALLGVAGCAATAVTPTSSTVQLGPTPSPSTTAPAPTSAATATAATVAAPLPIAPATTVNGTGSATVPITKPAGATTVIATISGGSPGRHFGVRALDGGRQQLVQTEGLYRGSTLLDSDGGTTTQLHVFARGPWTITLSDPRSAPTFSGSFSGSGDTVAVYQGDGGTATMTGGAAGTRFQVSAYGAGQLSGTLVYATDVVNRSIQWPGGVALISVRAVGPWSISFA